MITSPSNPRIKAVVKLRGRRHREKTGLFPIEGFRELRRALDAGIRLSELFYCPDLFLGHDEPGLLERAATAGAALAETGPAAFHKVSYRDRPEGLLAVAEQFDTSLGGLVLPAADALVLVAEGIEKPGNLGTMLRTAAAAGVDAVIVCDPTTDPFNPNVVRASLGTLFVVPLAVASTDDTLAWLAERGLQTVAADPDGAIGLWDADLSTASAVVIGSEQYGLSGRWREAASTLVRIPMPGSVDSLNAAMAAGIVLFEAVRQRGGRSGSIQERP